MLNQIAYTRTGALAFASRSVCCTHRAPLTQAGQVGETSSTTRLFPRSPLNRSRRSRGPCRSTSVAARVEEDGSAADARQRGAVVPSERLAASTAMKRRLNTALIVGVRAG